MNETDSSPQKIIYYEEDAGDTDQIWLYSKMKKNMFRLAWASHNPEVNFYVSFS